MKELKEFFVFVTVKFLISTFSVMFFFYLSAAVIKIPWLLIDSIVIFSIRKGLRV